MLDYVEAADDRSASRTVLAGDGGERVNLNASAVGITEIKLRRSKPSRSPDSGYASRSDSDASLRASSSTVDNIDSHNKVTSGISRWHRLDGSYSVDNGELPVPNTGEPYLCLHPSCSRRFSRSHDLVRHIQTHFAEDTSRYDCPERGCGRVGERGFTRRDHLVEHRKKMHMKETRKLSLIPEYVKKSLSRQRNSSEKEEDIPNRSSPAAEVRQNEKETGEPSVLESVANAMDGETSLSDHDHLNDIAGVAAYSGSCPKCHHLHTRVPFELTRDPSMHMWFKCECCGHQMSGLERLSPRTTLTMSKAMPSSFSARQLDTKASSACSTSTTQSHSDTTSSRITKRIRWQCRCGHKSYDDFLELRSGAVEEYESLLRRRLNTENDQSQNHGGAASLLRSIPGWNRMTQSMRRMVSGKTPALPQYELEISPEDRPQPSTPDVEMLYLLLCLPHQRFATKLLQLDLSTIKSDQHLFSLLRNNYLQMRGRLRSFFSLKSLRNIKFVQFEMYRSDLVDIQKQDDLPPPDLKDVYRYNPIPAEKIPPVGENHMLHLCTHPECADETGLLFDRIPKKLKERLAVCPQKGSSLGWGIHFVEGWHFGIITLLAYIILLLASFVFLVCWAVLKKDVQAASGVASYVLAFLALGVGSVQAAFELH